MAIKAEEEDWNADPTTDLCARARGMIDADLRRVNDQLHNQANGIAKDMARLLRDLETGVRINELGIVQGSGSDLDRLCAQRHTLIDIKHTLEGSTK